jgi:hypothetical protein
MSTVGTKAFLGGIEVNVSNLYLGNVDALINPFTKPQFPTNGLIAAFDATNTNSYPGSGSQWYDLSANKLVATTFSSSTFPTYNSTNFELTFAGEGSTNALYAYISSSVNTGSIIQDFSQVMWLRQPDFGGGAERGIVNLQNTAPASINFDAISFDQNANYFRLTSAFAARNVTANVEETVFNSYLMIAATRTSGTNNFRIYREGGELIGSGSYTPSVYTGTAASGLAILMGTRFFNNVANSYPADGWWTGSLSSVIMYNRALSSDELDAIYKLGRFGIKV